MTTYTPAQLEAWAGLSWKLALSDDTTILDKDRRIVAELCCSDNEDSDHLDYNNPDEWPLLERNAALIAAAPDLARLVLEQEKEIARLRSEVRLCHMQVESAYKELGRATAKVKAWEEIVCLDPSSDPFKVVMSDDWVEQEQVKVQIPSVEKLTTLLNELAAARQAMKETRDE